MISRGWKFVSIEGNETHELIRQQTTRSREVDSMKVIVYWPIVERHKKWVITEKQANDLESLTGFMASKRDLTKYDFPSRCNRKKKAQDEPNPWAAFFHELCSEYLTKPKSDELASATLVASYRIVMPVWKAYAYQTPNVKKKWDDAYRQVWNHELGHEQRFKHDIESVKRKLESTAIMTIAEFFAFMNSEITRIEEVQKEYDRTTNHGRPSL